MRTFASRKNSTLVTVRPEGTVGVARRRNVTFAVYVPPVVAGASRLTVGAGGGADATHPETMRLPATSCEMPVNDVHVVPPIAGLIVIVFALVPHVTVQF